MKLIINRCVWHKPHIKSISFQSGPDEIVFSDGMCEKAGNATIQGIPLSDLKDITVKSRIKLTKKGLEQLRKLSKRLDNLIVFPLYSEGENPGLFVSGQTDKNRIDHITFIDLED